MSTNGTDVKKRKLPNNDDAFLGSSTKKIKVQAQRKFAQNAVTPTNTQKPVQSPVVPSNSVKPPIKRPNTEDFLTFLCFRGTSLLPPRLDFFNKPQRSAQEIAAGKKRRKSTPILPVNNSNSNSNNVNNKLSETKNIRQLPQNTGRLTKLGQKVIDRNLVRSSSRYAAVRQEALTLRQLALHHGSKVIKPKLKVKKPPPVIKNVKKDIKKDGKQKSLDGKKVPTLINGRSTRSNSLPSIFCPGINQLRDDKGKWCKRGSSKTSSRASDDSKDVEERPSRKKTATKSIDHRSNSLGNLKQKTSDIKCKVANKNDRKTRSLAGKHKRCDQDNYVISDKKSDKNLKTVSKSNKANSLIEKKLTVNVKRKTSSVDSIKTSRENKDAISSPRSRPPRRTKEAATLYMEMLRKDMRCPDEQEDDTSSVESFPDLPNTRINEQRERELKVFSKKNITEKKLNEQQWSDNEDKSRDKHFLSLSNSKKTVVDNNVKEKKKSEDKILKKKNTKEAVKILSVPENDGTTSFKRNLRPRRSSTMLDDYIMTDSEEDDEKSEPVPVETMKSEIHKLSTVTTVEVKSKKCKLSIIESDKKNLKTHKTDLKPKKDLNKIDSEVKKNQSKSKSKGSLLKNNKEPEIKNNKNNTANNKIEKLSKNKTETETLVITEEPTKIIGKGSKNAGKKVPRSIKQQQLMKKENVSNKKKLDLYNNNGSKKKATLLPVTSSASPSIFSGDTSQIKENVLECMAANFESKVEKPISNSIVEKHKITVEEKKEPSVDTSALEKQITNNDNEVELDNHCKSVVQHNKLDLKKITKIENVVLTAKEEHMDVAKKTENVIAVRTVDKLEKTESLQLMMPLKKVENNVFQTVAKDLFLQAKNNELKVTVPDYFSSKSFQLSNRFKQDDGLSVLSEICCALPRCEEPYSPPVLLPQPLEKKKEFSLVSSPAVTQSTLLPPLFPPQSFESRTVKIVNLARGNCTTTSASMDNKKDLTTWNQVLKNVKVPINGLTSTANLVGSNLIQSLTQKKELPVDNRQMTSKIIAVDQSSLPTVNGNCGIEEKKPESSPSYLCQKTNFVDSKTDVSDVKKGVLNSSYLAKTTILNSTKYDLKFEKRHSTVVAINCEKPINQQQRKDADVSSSDDLQSPEKKIFGHQRRLSASQSYNCNSSDAFSPDNETSVYAFQPDLPVPSTPFRRNKPQSPAKSRTVSPNNSISVSIENDLLEEKSLQSTVSSTTDVDSEEGRLFYIPLPAGVQAQPLIQGVTVKLGTEGPQNKLVMSAKLVTKPPALTIPVSSISPKPERKIKPLCSTKINNSSTPVGTVQPTTRTVQPTKCTPSTSKQLLPLSPQLQNMDTKDEKKRLQQIVTAITNPKELKKPSSYSVSANSKKPKKTEKQVNKRKSSEKVASKKKLLKESAEIMEAPTFYPSEEDFKDPLEYFDIIKSVAQKYGICRVVPPPSFKPDCKVSDDMRFTAYNQYVHKMMDRWGPNVRELIALKKYLETQSIILSNPPLIGGMELDLPRLYHTVQELGGLKEVIELDKWSRVADLMKIPKGAQVSKLDDIYCKYLLPYDTLSHDERQKLIAEVDKEWKQICKKGDSENELYEDVNDCIIKGRSIALNAYFRVARNTAAMWFKEQQYQGGSNTSSSSAAMSNKLGTAAVRAEEVESLYWKQVQEKKNHICVLSGSIDSGAEGYGFPTTKTATFTKHPWNLKVLTNNSASVLKSLGPVMGMTVPTIHMGMMFSACCWYKDPHGLPWIEYLHTGADKVWYGVPSGQSDNFQAAMKRLLPRAVAEGQNHHTWLAADSGMVPPDMIIDSGVSVTRTIQNPGQFLIVMPHAYTCNVSTGYVISESVYFTQSNWLSGAEKIFQDLQRNCEPAAFSFEKLLINMSSDQRTPQSILKQLLGILSNMRDCEIALRSQLVEDLGLKTSERIRPVTSKSNEQDDDYECGVCHSILYISMVNNSHEDCDYCLRHGIEILSKKHNQLKYCKFMYTFDEDELDLILVKLRERIDSKKKKMSYTKS